MVINYFKYLAFYLSEVLGTLVNLGCAVFSYYPKVELGVSLLFLVEKSRYNEENVAQEKRRIQLSEEADSTFDEAKSEL